MKPWYWVALAAGAGGVVLLWTHYVNSPGDTSWTDPHQPPAMVAAEVCPPGGRPVRGCDYTRSYPDSLSAWDGTVVGQC